MSQKYDEVLLPFLSLMRKELHANSRKGDRPGWLAMGANVGLLEIYWHVAKLSAAVKNNDGPAIMEHSADVANMAMMVLDICGGLAWVEQPDQPAAANPALLALWRAACEEAECVITGGQKCLVLTEEMLIRVGGAIEDACGVRGSDAKTFSPAHPDGGKG